MGLAWSSTAFDCTVVAVHSKAGADSLATPFMGVSTVSQNKWARCQAAAVRLNRGCVVAIASACEQAVQWEEALFPTGSVSQYSSNSAQADQPPDVQGR